MSDWIIRLIEQTGYLGVGFLMFLETVFPPIPSEIIMTVAGLAASREKMSLAGVVASGATGAMIGNMFWYFAARVIGLDRLRPLIERFGRFLTLNWDEIEKAKRLFGTQGWAIVMFGRILPILRSLISIPAGLLDMRLRTYFIFSTIGTVGWVSLIAGAGFALGSNFEDVEKFVGPLSSTVFALIIGTYIWRLIVWTPSA
jgi:membrane protein DedA with SNARE-associated domain